MTLARKGALALIAIMSVGAAALAFRAFELPGSSAVKPAAERPELLLLTSLPIVFGDGFSLEGMGSPTLKALETRYRLIPISVTDEAELAKGELLMMAQPSAQSPENLVALDQWVRGGGRMLLLADPVLEWPSTRPLGDRLRPPIMFADTGLLAHWGLRLDAPDQRGPVKRELSGRQILALSPGALVGKCRISGDSLVARCSVGEGRATVVADADLLNVEEDQGQEANLDAVLRELATLERG